MLQISKIVKQTEGISDLFNGHFYKGKLTRPAITESPDGGCGACPQLFCCSMTCKVLNGFRIDTGIEKIHKGQSHQLRLDKRCCFVYDYCG